MQEVKEILGITYSSVDGVYNRYVKRVLGFVMACIFFILLIPVFLVIAVAVILESGRPVFYCALRGGYHNKPFRIVKFRTMVKDAEKCGGTTALNDSRITKVGEFLRKTKLDEIPQLINIIRGDMSFIGPRPELTKYTDAYTPEEQNILCVRPGITDFSSIEFVNLDEIVGAENADEQYEKYVLKKKNDLRLRYVAAVSFPTDIKLFLHTLDVVLRKACRYVFKRKAGK